MADISARLRFEVLKRDNFRCKYCGRTSDAGVVLHVDHVVAKSNGGANEIDNLVTACADCNFGKTNKALIENESIVKLDQFAGHYFLSYKPCACGDPETHRELHNKRSSEKDLHLQGQILFEVAPGLYMIQLFSWFDGVATARKIVKIEDFLGDWEFFQTDYEMRFRTAMVTGNSMQDFENMEKAFDMRR